ncbi:MAG: SRPBCC family protein [Sphingomonadales bacterium]|nr:SRPBCC family protein [Sphingomonadales bacterium]
MIETTQAVTVAAPIDAVWAHARDVSRWAEIMPGYRECQILDDDHSHWVLKVGVGGLVRTVKVNVTVTRWAGPEAVDFEYALEGDPVSGGGTYRATATEQGTTHLELHVRVIGGGPMAPMWEAMGRPLLPKFALGFANELKAAIEAETNPQASSEDAGMLAKLGRIFSRKDETP